MTGSNPPGFQRRRVPNVHSIPAGQNFLDVLADAVLHDRLGLGISLKNPAGFARLTVYLPTRRAARAFASVLLQASGLKALILPRLVPLGDPGEADMNDVLDAVPGEAVEANQILPINPLARQLLLAIQIRQASAARDRAMVGEAASGSYQGGSLGASSLGSAFALAGDLAAILDAMQAENIPYERLLGLDAARFDELWQLTARFLAILGETWPLILADLGVCDPVTWRNGLIAGQASRLDLGLHAGPVIVAGSTGSMPATAGLMRIVAQLPHGAVVLPDLDLTLKEADDVATASPDRGASHPQAQLSHLLTAMQTDRASVCELKEATPDSARGLRRTLAHEALRPADTTAAWRTLYERLSADEAECAFSSVDLIEAPDERGEALSIALLIRQKLADPARQIALVTPDRGLAERVAIELQRWGIMLDDSAGRPLGRTSAGHALLLVLDVLRSGAAARDLLELARHPALHLGMEPGLRAAARQALEIGALRGVQAVSGFARLKAAVAGMPDRIANPRAPRPRQRLTVADVAGATELVSRLEVALLPVLTLLPNPGAGQATELDLGACVTLVRQALVVLATDADGRVPLFADKDGEALGILIDDLEAGLAGASGGCDDLARVCRTVMAERVVRLKGRQHPRVTLLGPLEARLMAADLVILGGLNEGSWPPQTRTDPFLNRAMRAELGLSSPERRIGQSAHDFIQAFTAPEVVLSRSVKASGVQSLPSRFWQRLKAIVPPATWAAAHRRGAVFAALASRIDQPASIKACDRPKPMPPARQQPTKFSVTEAETLYRDPYAIFARRILDLTPLEPQEMPLGASDRGQLMHSVLERFAHAWPVALPPEPLNVLLDEGRAVFRHLMHEPDVAAFWWPRFVMLAPRIVQWESARRVGIIRIGAEMRIRHALRLTDGTEITLTARADRIEERVDGDLVILDFKTGSIPTQKQIKTGLAPQLLLEAALAPLAPFNPVAGEAGRPSFAPADVGSALYLALKPGANAMQEKPVVPDVELAARAGDHLAGFIRMVEDFRSGERGFTSRFAAQFMR
ncbi:MAG: double-strand break repair protein AddB, partial [Bosea sp. (in: a-proteobacteria)]